MAKLIAAVQDTLEDDCLICCNPTKLQLTRLSTSGEQTALLKQNALVLANLASLRRIVQQHQTLIGAFAPLLAGLLQVVEAEKL